MSMTKERKDRDNIDEEKIPFEELNQVSGGDGVVAVQRDPSFSNLADNSNLGMK